VLIEAAEVALISDVNLTVLAASPDMRLRVTKALLKGNSKQFKLLDPWDRKGIVALIKTLAQPYGFKLKVKTLEFVADSFGNDSGRIDCEFQKLRSVYPNGITDEQAITAMSKADTDTVFDFVDAVLDLDIARALKLLYKLDEPTQKTVALLTQKVHNVYCVSLGVPVPISPAQENFFKRKYNKGSSVYLGILTALNSMGPYPNRDDLIEALYDSLGDK
jgi:DNA polymerase III delta subunit